VGTVNCVYKVKVISVCAYIVKFVNDVWVREGGRDVENVMSVGVVV